MKILPKLEIHTSYILHSFAKMGGAEMGFHQEADPIQGPNSSPARSGFQVISLAEKAGNSLVKMK